MNWSSILSVAKQLGTGLLLIGVIVIVSFGRVAQTKERVAKYKKLAALWTCSRFSRDGEPKANNFKLTHRPKATKLDKTHPQKPGDTANIPSS